MFPTLRRPNVQRTPSPRRRSDHWDYLLEPLEAPWTAFSEAEFPSVDVQENENEFVAKADLPGMEPEDIDVSIRDNSLVVQGEKKYEEESGEGDYRCRERRYGSFYRLVPLASEVDEDNVKAKYKKGVLEVRIPKTSKSKSESKKIKIES